MQLDPFYGRLAAESGRAGAGRQQRPAGRLGYTAVGDAVKLARRLEENAAGGQVLRSETAYRQVAGRSGVRSLGPLSVQWWEQPVQV